MMTTFLRRYAPISILTAALINKNHVSSTSCTATGKVSNYARLQTRLKEIECLNGVKGLVGWDEMVLMQPGSSQARNDQKSALAAVIYEKETSNELEDILNTLQDKKELDQNEGINTVYDQAVIREAKRDFLLAKRKSKEQAMLEAELEGKGYQAWIEARSTNNFQLFQPILQDILKLKKEISIVTRPHLSLYDGNIDIFERGMKSERLFTILNSAKTKLIPLIQQVCKSDRKQKYIVPEELKGGELWKVENQVLLCKEVAEAIGFDFNKGRLDVSVHPFTGGSHPTDVRITTRYSQDNWLQGIAGTIHEVGHALYEQGRNPAYDNLPVTRALSMGVHESQSLFWERMIFQSPEFWQWFTPLIHKHFPHTVNITSEQFYEYINQIHPGFIRVDADELTYPLHIVLRYELESGMFDGSIAVQDIPMLWNQKMKESLNLQVETDSQGCLQDVHWSFGGMGYFPSYTLGAMIAAQLMETIESTAIPNVRDQIRQGQFAPLRQWMITLPTGRIAV